MSWIDAKEIGSAVQTGELERLVREAEGKTVLELGSFYGRSTLALASVARSVDSVDWHRGEAASEKDNGLTDSLPALWANIRKYGLQDKVTLHVGTTQQVLPKFRSMMFDFAFIDADHTYDWVTFDILATLPLMMPGSKIFFHDYTWDELGVKEAVDEHFPEVEVVNTSAIVQV